MKSSWRTLSILLPLALTAGCGSGASTADAGTGGADGPPENAEVSFSCSVTQGFNFQKDAQDLVGFVDYLKIAGSEMSADLSVTDPENVSATKKVAGVLSAIYWNGGYAAPVQFSAQVSLENQVRLATLVHTSLSNTEVEFSFTVYAYDPKAKQYYKAFHTNGANLKGLILKQGGELAIAIATDPSVEVQAPKNYTFNLGVMPQDQAMTIFLAASTTDKWTKQWGVSIAP